MSEIEPPRWGLARKLGFRFLFSYFVLYALPFPIGNLPWTDKLAELYGKLLEPPVLWVGQRVLGIDYPIGTVSNGSGDRTYDFVLMFCQLALAVAAAGIWTLVDRRSPHHERLLDGLRVYVRVFLGTIMLSYGFAKIVEGQFVAPDTGQLAKTYGESSPMNLLWTFMGVSRPYTMFAGFMEAIPGALLFYRRTATVAALLLLAVMANVVLLNFCYDVPVKLFSSHLWLMSLFLAAPAFPRLLATLVLDRSAPPAIGRRRFLTSRRARIATCAYVVLIGALTYHEVAEEVKRQIERSEPPEAKVVRDLYAVEEMTLNDPGPRWERVLIRRHGVRIYLTDGTSEVYRSDAVISGPTPLTLELRRTTDEEGTRRGRLDLRPQGGGYVLEGVLEGKKVTARLARIAIREPLLTTRGFHWINEVPFNR